MTDDQTTPAAAEDAEPKPAPRVPMWTGRIHCGMCGHDQVLPYLEPVAIDATARYRCEICGTEKRQSAYQVEG